MLVAVIIVYSGFAVLYCYASMAPFFPSELEKRGYSPLYNSLVFAIYALSYVVFAFCSKKCLIPSLGRIRTFVLGVLIQLTALLMLALLPFIQSDAAFLLTGVLT